MSGDAGHDDDLVARVGERLLSTPIPARPDWAVQLQASGPHGAHGRHHFDVACALCRLGGIPEAMPALVRTVIGLVNDRQADSGGSCSGQPEWEAENAQLRAGGDATPPEPGSIRTPGQLWYHLLELPEVERLAGLTQLLRLADDGFNCVMFQHGAMQWEIERLGGELRAMRRAAQGGTRG